MERLEVGTRVETAHGRHHALETGTVREFKYEQEIEPWQAGEAGYSQAWYRVEMDCGCCEYSFDVRSDGYGRIRAAR